MCADDDDGIRPGYCFRIRSQKKIHVGVAQTCSDSGLAETEREQRLINWESAPHARYCHPREEHLLPLQVCYGIGQAPATTVFQEKVAGFIASAYQWN